MNESINVEHSNDLGRRDVKYDKENLSRCHFVHHKSNANHTEIETGPLQ
jgi:hypothetical protein